MKVNISYKVTDVFSENKINIKIDPSYKSMVGRVIFPSSKRGWLYSKILYPLPETLLDVFQSTIKGALAE